jgi:DNA-binding beta-propeller fold protein YncE
VIRDLHVGPDPLQAVAAGGSVWTLNFDDGTMSRIDRATGNVSPIQVGIGVGLASDGTDVWLAHDERFLSRIDGLTGTVERDISMARRPLFALRNAGFPVVAGGKVWITVPNRNAPDGPQRLWRIDPDSGTTSAKIPIGPDPLPPFAAFGAIWIATRDGTIDRIDLGALDARIVDIGAGAGSFATGRERLWVSSAGHVHELDPQTGSVLTTLPVIGAARGMAWVQGAVWVATATGVERLDPNDGSVGPEIRLADPSADEGPIGCVPVGTTLWVSIETG